MNSERIQQVFGSYGVDVLLQSDQQRVSSLYSLQLGKKITRTLAVVSYPESIPPSISNEHAKILSGQSIGEVLKNSGWQIEKHAVYLDEIESSPEYDGVYALMGGIEYANLALHVYQIVVSKGDQRYRYVRIAEIHHPDYLNTTTIRRIYQIDSIEQTGNQKTTLDEVTRVMTDLP